MDTPSDDKGIEQLPSGKFRVKLRDPTGARKWMPGGGPFATREEAVRYRRGVLAILADAAADNILPEANSLQRIGAAWLDEQELHGDTRSIDTYRSQWRAHVDGTEFAAKAVTSLTSVDVRAWVDALVKKHALVPTRGGESTHTRSTRKLSRDTASKVLSMVRQILERQVEKGLIEDNPARDVHVRAARARTDEVWTYLTLDEIARLRTSAIPDPAKTIFLVALYTGLRQGELWGLHWRDVLIDGDQPRIVVRYSRKGATKSGKVRHVPLLAPARELLSTWKRQCPKGPQNIDGLVFPTSTGRMRSKGDDARWADYHVPRVVRAADGSRRRENVRVDGYAKRLQLGRHARFHDLRHTCASHLIMGSWGVQWTLSEIAAYLGHSDTEVTERYAHLSPDHLHRKAAATALPTPHVEQEPGSTYPPLYLVETAGAPKRTRTSNLQIRSAEAPAVLSSTCPPTWNARGTPADHARAVLEAVASGDLPESTLQDLCFSILTQEPVRIAAELLRDTSPHRARRAVLLALSLLNPVVGASTDADSADSADSSS